MSDEFGFHVIDAVLPIDVQQKQVRHMIETDLSDYFLRYQLELKEEEEAASQESTPVEMHIPEPVGGESR
jgi:hypothetical protein